ncbi:hypothetical protein ACFQT0_07490 [Hymenobacter humi]|uniref:DUF3300 domain-containing protein n=1 Tax=Hymenobacter humi TaxID=1411620 RepID=A0ABW2U4L5_9BACT
MQGLPGYGPGVTYYVPYSPYTSLSYDPFYSPFYSPFYGSSVSISLGFGRPWGYGGFYGRPYGYSSFYDPFYYSSPFYGGYYGRGGYYGNRYYGNSYYGSNFGYGTRSSGNENVRVNRTYGHLNRRDSDGRYTSGSTTGNPNGGNISGRPNTGRARTDDQMAPSTPLPDGARPTNNDGRLRSESVTGNTADNPAGRSEGYNRPRRQQRADEPVYRDMSQPTEAGRVTTEDNRGRVRENTAPEPQAAPQEVQRRRGGWFSVPAQPSNAGSQSTEQPQPVRQRAYDQPRQQRQERTYEQPRQQSYEQPQRSSQPSYSAPAAAPSNNSGGSRGRSRAD